MNRLLQKNPPCPFNKKAPFTYKGAFHTMDHWPLMTVPVPGVLAGGVVAVIPSAVGVGVTTGAGAKVGMGNGVCEGSAALLESPKMD